MKKTFSLIALSIIVLLSSCIARFEDYNHNPDEATPDQMDFDNLSTGAYFAQMERGVFCVGENMGGRYQITQALEGDLFASYFAAITSWGYAPYNNDHYALYFDWYDAPFNDAYEKIMTPWKAIYDATDEFSPARAMATVVKVFAMQRITDMYGPIPYSQFGTAVQVAYDSQESVYNQMFDEIAGAIDVLTEYATNNSAAYLADYDNVYYGNVVKWVKFANTVRLRMAMRISNVDAAKARTQIEAVIGNAYGLMVSKDDDAAVHQSSSLTFRHPLWEIGTSWDDEHMSATMDCYLNGYNDPRIAAYFQPAVSTGLYKGVRNGIANVNKNTYLNNTSRPNFVQNSDMHWMYAAEAYFLMAEAKLRFDIGDLSVKEYYEAGISASFASAGVTGAETYAANGTNLPLSAFVNPSNNQSTNVASMLSLLPVAWDESASANTKLERIMIQKWIALYPDGQEAWSEMRRTGYPGWVRINSYSYQSEVASNEMISRLKFPSTEYTNNSENTQAAVALLGGRDSAGSRLWWDVNR